MTQQNFLRMPLIALTFAFTLAFVRLGATPNADAAGPWTNGQAANVVLGQPNFTSYASGTSDSAMYEPQGVAVDPTTGKVFVADSQNNRILRFSSANAAINGSAAEAVLGQVDFTHGSINAGHTVTATANSLYHPFQVTVDSSGHLWVADTANSRVLRFDNASTKTNGANADGVLGQATFVENTENRGGAVAANTLQYPAGLWVDTLSALWVADNSNNRVLGYASAATKPNGASADVVLGQPGFTTNGFATTQNGMNYPTGVVTSNSGTLFVADSLNGRVLRFNNVDFKGNGENADGVLGQANYTTTVHMVSQSRMFYSDGVALDNDGRLYVSDASSHRIMIFNDAATKANGADADNVLGQTNFTTGTSNTGGISASTLHFPLGIFFDRTANALWVADRFNNRVLRHHFVFTLVLPLIVR